MRDRDTKAAVMAALLAGQGVCEVANEFKIPKQTVSGWKVELGAEQLRGILTKNGEHFGDLLAYYLQETVKTLAVQAEHFRDTDWLQKQSADSLAVLHGVQTDKAIRLLTAIESAAGPDAA